MDWFELPIMNVEKATDDATSVTFLVPANIKDVMDWLPGQHIRLQLPIGGKLLSRSYSISSPLGEALRITVKKVKKGKGSGYINDELEAGHKLSVASPMGSFVLQPDVNARRSHYFFAAGSGITPIYSMLVSMLENEPNSVGYLLYGNKDSKSTIFAEEFHRLQQRYPDRFTLCHCHSSPSWFSRSPWCSKRIDAEVVHDFIQENPPYAQDAQYYLCGPGSFLPDVKRALNEIDVPNSRIHLESFGGGLDENQYDGITAALQIDLGGHHSSSTGRKRSKPSASHVK